MLLRAVCLQNLVRALLPSECWDSLPAATARLCAPHWLEAAGWLAALMSDATAAAMGRLPAAQRPEQPRSYVDLMASTGIQQFSIQPAEVAANALMHYVPNSQCAGPASSARDK